MDKEYPTDEWTNVTPTIIGLTERKLHKNPDHPIGIIKSLIEHRFAGPEYTFYNDFEPVVSKYENFDVLGFPEDHPGRSKTDTYYVNHDTLLRTHTSAHEHECFQKCKTPGYFIVADVYRRDAIDRTHYPGFHQLEGARSWSRKEHGDNLINVIANDIKKIAKTDLIVEDPPYNPETNPKQSHMSNEEVEVVSQHLKRTIELMVNDIFNLAKQAAIKAGSTDPDLFKPLKIRWIEAYFPWTAPSWEIEVWWKGDWLECCGCGLVQQQVLDGSGVSDYISWALGIGLDRLAMVLFGIPDIRLFWSKDDRFGSQFKAGEVTNFKSFSKYPNTIRDVSFWLPKSTENVLHENDLMELVRNTAGDMVETVSLHDEFINPKTGRKSQCYRISYRSMERNLTNDEINVLQEIVRKQLTELYDIELR